MSKLGAFVGVRDSDEDESSSSDGKNDYIGSEEQTGAGDRSADRQPEQRKDKPTTLNPFDYE